MSVPTTPDDIDEIAVERAANGDRSIPLNRAEMRAAWLILERRGHSSRSIATLLGVAGRTVVRWRTGEAEPISRPPGIRSPRPLLFCPDCDRPLASQLSRHRRRQHAEQLAS